MINLSCNSVIIYEFVLGTNLNNFLSLFWLDKLWYEKFLGDILEDKDVVVGEWTSLDGNLYIRDVDSQHPSTISFPGLPSHAESIRTQRMITSYTNDKPTSAIIHESNSFKGIPYSDYFTIQVYWNIKQQFNSEDNNYECQISISIEFIFTKSTWLQSTIESNTKAELLIVYNKWRNYALQHLSTISPSSFQHESSMKIQMQMLSRNTSTSSIHIAPNRMKFSSLSMKASQALNKDSTNKISSSYYYDYSTDDDFYDCEEGEDYDSRAEIQQMQQHCRSESIALLLPHTTQRYGQDNSNSGSSNKDDVRKVFDLSHP
eukprot:gene11707-24528_t